MCEFPDKLKLAEITPIPKKGDSLEIGDYRPISIVPAVSMLFEKAILEQLNSFLCSFRKGHSTQHALFRLLTSRQNGLDKGEIVGAVLSGIPIKALYFVQDFYKFCFFSSPRPTDITLLAIILLILANLFVAVEILMRETTQIMEW